MSRSRWIASCGTGCSRCKVRVPLEYPKRKLAVSLVHPAFRSHGSHHVRKRRLSMMLAKDQELIVIDAYPRLLLLHVSDGFRFLLGIFVELLPVLGIASRLRPPEVGEPQAAWPAVSFMPSLCENC